MLSIRELNPEKKNKLLRYIYTEIVRGYSTLEWNNSLLYIKHLNHFDAFDTEEYYAAKYQYALDNGMAVEQERLEILKRMNLWGQPQEDRLRDLNEYLDGLQKSRRKLITHEDKQINKTEIDKTIQELTELNSEKMTLVGRTCESFAAQKQNEYYLMHTLYTDNSFNKLFFNFEEFDALESEELNELFLKSNTSLNNFCDLNVKYLALSSFFQNVFGLSESVYEFFGKPVSTLTFYQVNLSLYGSNYKFMTAQSENIPADVKEDPELFESWYNDRQNIQKIEEKAGGPTNIIGGNNQSSTRGENVIDLNSLKKNKGKLSKDDILQAISSNASD